MKIWTACLLLLITRLVSAQEALTVSVEKQNNGVSLYAENLGGCPISVSLTLDVVNMSHSHNPYNFIVVPANTKKYLLAALTRASAGAYSYKYNYKWYYGDVRNKSLDTAYVYELPYATDSAYAVSQGYYGSFSHQGIKALDFKMPEGTPVLAARGGTVAWVVQHNTQSCASIECKGYNNVVVIYHDDGSVGEYLHLSPNSARVKTGDRVQPGQMIAKSGNTGFSSTPHLHFWTYRLAMNGIESLPTKFRVGSQVVLLSAGFKYYKRAK